MTWKIGDPMPWGDLRLVDGFGNELQRDEHGYLYRIASTKVDVSPTASGAAMVTVTLRIAQQ